MERSRLIVILLLVFFVSLVVIGFVDAKPGDNKGQGQKEIKVKDSFGNEKSVHIATGINNGVGKKKINVGGDDEYGAETELEIEVEDGEVTVKLGNGQTKKIKVLPDEIAIIAIEEFGNEELEIEIVEEDGEAVYSVETEKVGRLFGIFKKKVKIKGTFDSETGEFIGKKKAWWAFLVSGEDDDQFENGGKVTVCHVPPGNPAAQHTISVGAPAVRAHLAHGDFLGACAGDDGGDDGNDTTQNLTLEILSPENNLTYLNESILVDLFSNGDFVEFTINNGSAIEYNGSVIMVFLEGENVIEAFANNSEGEELMDRVEFFVDLNMTLPDDGNMTDDNSTEGNMTDGNSTDGNFTIPDDGNLSNGTG